MLLAGSEITNQLAAKRMLPLNSFAKIRLLKGGQSIWKRMAAIRHAAIRAVEGWVWRQKVGRLQRAGTGPLRKSLGG